MGFGMKGGIWYGVGMGGFGVGMKGGIWYGVGVGGFEGWGDVKALLAYQGYDINVFIMIPPPCGIIQGTDIFTAAELLLRFYKNLQHLYNRACLLTFYNKY